MKLHVLMEEFSGRCFVNVTEAKITEDGFEFVYHNGTYDSLIYDFIDHINIDKLAYIDIQHSPPGIENGNLTFHFYDHYYYRPWEKKPKVEQKAEEKDDFPSPFPF